LGGINVGEANRRCPDRALRVQLAIERNERLKEEALERKRMAKLERERYLASLPEEEREAILRKERKKNLSWLAVAGLLANAGVQPFPAMLEEEK
jgi:hypothetical protein